MTELRIFVILISLNVSFCSWQAWASAPQSTQTQGSSITRSEDGNQSTARGNQSFIQVELNKSLDARKLKAGDLVEAKITTDLKSSDGTFIPRGSIVKGHVVEASSRANGAPESSLRLSFDSIVPKHGPEMPITGQIKAVGASPSFAAPHPPESTQPPVGPGTVGTGPALSRDAVPPPSSQLPNPTPSGPSAGAVLTSESTGVVGIPNVQMQGDSTLTSQAKDLKLDAGTMMILRVQNQ